MVALVLRPFTTRKATEIIAAPKVYGFDTGFVCAHRGWHDLRREDLGVLWEHFVLNELMARTQSNRWQYWRDKAGHEVDFIWQPRGHPPLAIECKWAARDFDASNLQVFARLYPKAAAVVVTTDAEPMFRRNIDGLNVEFLTLEKLGARLAVV
jgi:hypothetical protein